MLGTVKHHVRRLVKDVAGPQILGRLPRRTDLPLELFGLEIGSSGHLHLGDVDLVDLADEYGSPLQVVDRRRLDEAVLAAVGPSRAGTGSTISYSYKTNPVPAVLERIHAEGIGAEVISAYELWLAMQLGVPANEIIYNGPAKSIESVRIAIEAGVKSINANTESEAARIAELAGEIGTTAVLGVRVALPGMWGGQFGLTSTTDAVDRTILAALADDRVDLAAIHVHRGNTIRTADDMTAHVNQILDFIGGVHDRTGWYPRMVDVGGSLSCATVAGFPEREFRLNRLLGSDLLPPDPGDAISIAGASTLAAGLVAEHARQRGQLVPEVILEPGRALTANSQLLLTTVHDIKDDVELHHAVMDAGINIADTAAHEYHQLFSASAPTAEAVRSYRLAGPICTPADVLYNNWRLPQLAPGHVLAIMDAGAYFVPFSTSFSFPRPAIVMIDDGAVDVVRVREQFDDLTRLDRWSGGEPR